MSIKQDTDTIFKLAKDSFLDAGLSKDEKEKQKLYARSAELFKEIKDLGKLPKTLEIFLIKSEKYSKNNFN